MSVEPESVTSEFLFDWIAVRRASYADPFPGEGPAKPFPSLLMELSLVVRMRADGTSARAQLELTMKPEPSSEPVVHAVVEGQFSARADAVLDKRGLRAFMESGRPGLILFPFLRERVQSITTQTRGSAILLPIMDTAALFRQALTIEGSGDSA